MPSDDDLAGDPEVTGDEQDGAKGDEDVAEIGTSGLPQPAPKRGGVGLGLVPVAGRSHQVSSVLVSEIAR